MLGKKSIKLLPTGKLSNIKIKRSSLSDSTYAVKCLKNKVNNIGAFQFMYNNKRNRK